MVILIHSTEIELVNERKEWTEFQNWNDEICNILYYATKNSVQSLFEYMRIIMNPIGKNYE